jgi:preprotein translocase SecE subunit
MANTVGNKPAITAGPAKFFKECIVELRKTSWSTKEELRKMTLLVLGSLFVVMLYIGVLDSFFGWALRQVHLN